jgi:hypothetical protein
MRSTTQVNQTTTWREKLNDISYCVRAVRESTQHCASVLMSGIKIEDGRPHRSHNYDVQFINSPSVCLFFALDIVAVKSMIILKMIGTLLKYIEITVTITDISLSTVYCISTRI